MTSIVIGSTNVRECEQCLGLWLDVAAFEKICAEREQQAAVLGTASPAPAHAVRETSKVNYVPCPQCSQLMNRINFARCSGVIVDFCKGHGTWFDRDELSRIVEFIRSGGLEESRNREKEDIKEERLKLLEQQRTEVRRSILTGRDVDDHRIPAIVSAKGLLKFLLDN